MPPVGLLTGNEEDYFQLAERFATGAATPPDSAVFDSSPHRALNEVLLGNLIIAIGYERAQIIARGADRGILDFAMCVIRSIWLGAGRRSDRARRLRSPSSAGHGRGMGIQRLRGQGSGLRLRHGRAGHGSRSTAVVD